ncbi:MAG TPA: cytochrome b [Alphaproteobacteria bacterium]|nr:cytochrome b [Alphaproteobacteria bacterium]
MTAEVRRYHAVAMSLHWLIALFLIANLAIGIGFDFMARPDRFWYMQLHKSLGITVLVLTCLRLLWRLFRGIPPEPASLKPWERWIAGAVHFLIYLLMFAIPFTGWLLVSSSPMHVPTVLFWSIPWPNLPFFDGIQDLKPVSHQFGVLHQWLAYGMIGLLVLHVGAALRHHWLLKEGILLRMTPVFMEGFLRRLRGERA